MKTESGIAKYFDAEAHGRKVANEREAEKQAAIAAGKIWDLDELEASAKRALIADSSGPRSSVQARRIAGERGVSGGGSRSRKREYRKKKLREECHNCGLRPAVDQNVCSCGAPLDNAEDRIARRFELWLYPDEADLLKRAKANGVKQSEWLDVLILQQRLMPNFMATPDESKTYLQQYSDAYHTAPREKDDRRRGNSPRVSGGAAERVVVGLRRAQMEALQNLGVQLGSTPGQRHARSSPDVTMAMSAATEVVQLLLNHVNVSAEAYLGGLTRLQLNAVKLAVRDPRAGKADSLDELQSICRRALQKARSKQQKSKDRRRSKP